MQSGETNGVEPRIREALLKAAPEGRITCPAARELAASLGVEPRVIGDACNRLKIKIKNCALGCF
ncbi:MAG: hypothetical protein PWQ99_1077 [Clostridia bacterium]|jgi:putative N-acetylmannosamine-6-phosphate epimerase|nr:hypothetical protein [Clostridia bacterium]MDN5365141.1 hypothetical protein [Thermacetogenium sp.]